jgi:thiosulfate/3-mercaptopyruvate sulfurtransferase
MSTILWAGLAALALGQADAKKYARPDLLIEAAELAKPAVAAKFRILDTRSKKEFAEGRIPGASFVDIVAWSKQFATGPNEAYFTARLAELGVSPGTAVVVYGESMTEVARAWWIARYWGIEDVRILNGGWDGWIAGKFPVQGKDDPVVVPKAIQGLRLKAVENRMATKDQLKASLTDKLLQIVDARTESEFCGEKAMAKRGGAIPGAVNLEWKMVVDTKTQRFKSAADMEKIFKQAGIDLAKPLAAHCQSGGRSSVMVFALELMGAAEARNYYRSWAEWGNADDTPVVVPKGKK